MKPMKTLIVHINILNRNTHKLPNITAGRFFKITCSRSCIIHLQTKYCLMRDVFNHHVIQISSGYVFGDDQPLILHLLDITPMMGVLNGVVMEIQVCNYRILKG